MLARSTLTSFRLTSHDSASCTARFDNPVCSARSVSATRTLFEAPFPPVRELNGRGVEFVQDVEKADWGSSAILRDPDGNQFVLSSQ